MVWILWVQDSARLDQDHWEGNDFLENAYYQVSTSNQTYSLMAPVCKILILQQINIEKNGFHRLIDRKIGVSKHIDL